MTENERQPVRAFTVDETAAGERLDKFLSTVCPDLTRSAAARVIEEGGVLLDGAQGNKKDKLRPGTRVELRLPEPKPMEVLPEHIPLDVVYEDGDLLVVNKPKGMVVHPAPGNYTGTLVNALLYYCGDSLSGVGGVIRPGIVHRIDKDTSGLLMVAKNDFAHVDLARQIQEHSFHRAYQAVVYGNMTADSGTVCQPIGRSPKDRKKNGGDPTEQQAGHYPLSCVGAIWGLYAYSLCIGDRTHPPNSGAHGLYRSSAGRRSGVRTAACDHLPGRAVPACWGDWLYTSQNRGGNAV